MTCMHTHLVKVIWVAIYYMQVQTIHMKHVYGFHPSKINGGRLHPILGIPKMTLKLQSQKWMRTQKPRYRSFWAFFKCQTVVQGQCQSSTNLETSLALLKFARNPHITQWILVTTHFVCAGCVYTKLENYEHYTQLNSNLFKGGSYKGDFTLQFNVMMLWSLHLPVYIF